DDNVALGQVVFRVVLLFLIIPTTVLSRATAQQMEIAVAPAEFNPPSTMPASASTGTPTSSPSMIGFMEPSQALSNPESDSSGSGQQSARSTSREGHESGVAMRSIKRTLRDQG